jgi:hypothetical protein
MAVVKTNNALSKDSITFELGRRAANQALDLAVNTSRDVERQVRPVSENAEAR